MFEWNDDFAVGIGEIDNQHKMLFKIGDELHSLTKLAKTTDCYDEIVRCINDLVSYTVFHFKTEEELFERFGYEDVEEHIQEHRKFIDYLNSVDVGNLDESQLNVVNDLTKHVAQWIFKHISYTDFKYKDYLREKMK